MYNGFIVTKDGEKYATRDRYEDAETFAVNLANFNNDSTIRVFFNAHNWESCLAGDYSYGSPDYCDYHAPTAKTYTRA